MALLGLMDRFYHMMKKSKQPDPLIITGIRDMEDYRKELRNKGVAGVKEKLTRDLNSWTDIEINIGIVGNSGTGKSTFINTIRGLKAEDPGAAGVGFDETTITCVAYTHPENKNFLVWDLPGVGTTLFPKETYLEKVEYDKYDFFIIMSKSRFTENDLWLALQIQKRDKKFFFVRSNIDYDVDNHKKDYPSSYNEQVVIQSIRSKTEKELNYNGVKVPKVFLINNRETDQYDFGKLNNELLASCDGLQKDSMALSLAAITKEVMAEKKWALRRRISAIALDVASSSTRYEQKGRFRDEITFYQKQFDIDGVTLAANKDILTLSDESIEEFKIVFDMHMSYGQMSVKTPTAMREEASTWERFKDFFRLSKENTLLYEYCGLALHINLNELCRKACELYDIKRTKQMVHALTK